MDTPHTAPPPAGTTALGASLRRSSSDRILLGLCGGIARAAGANPTFIRLAAVALGVVVLPLASAAYVATAVIIPRDDGSALLGRGTRDQRDIIVTLLYLVIAAPLVLGATGGSIFSGANAWPALLVGSIIAFVMAVWRPDAVFGGVNSTSADAAPSAASHPWAASPTAQDPATAQTVGGRSATPSMAADPHADAVTLVREAAATTGGPNFVKSAPEPGPGEAPTFVSPPAPSATPAARRGIALPVISILALIPSIFVVLVATGAIDSSWDAWSVMLALLAVGAAGGAVAIALLRPSYLGAGLLVLCAALLGGSSIAVNQLGPLLDDGAGERTYIPASASQTPRVFKLGFGEMKVDLRRLPLAPGSHTTIHTKIGFGQIQIVVPKGVQVVAAPGTKLPDLVVSAAENGASPKAGRTAPVIALDVQARGGQIDLLSGNAVHFENLDVISSQSTGFWGTTDETGTKVRDHAGAISTLPKTLAPTSP